MAYEVPALPYPYDALEPHIDEQTMTIHHDKHHQAYVDKAQRGARGHRVRRHADRGGRREPRRDPRGQARRGAQPRRRPLQPHALLGVDEPRRRRRPRRRPRRGDRRAFGSFDDFKAKFEAAGAGQFGSGWAWLVLDGGSLAVTSTPNQDTPLSRGPDAAARQRRLGARLLPDVPERAARVPEGVVEHRRLGQGRRALQRRLPPDR